MSVSGHVSQMTIVNVGISPTLLLADNDQRDHYYLELMSGQEVDTGPTTVQCIKPLRSVGDTFSDKGHLGSVYGQAVGGTSQVIVFEVLTAR